jgi:hypothetical protein
MIKAITFTISLASILFFSNFDSIIGELDFSCGDE